MGMPPPDWPQRSASHRIRLLPHDWHVQVWPGTGTNTGPEPSDVLLLHGAGASAHSWHPLVPFLSDARLIAPDLPGQGFSRTQARGRLGLDGMAEDLVQLCAAKGWRPRAIVAHSAGAAVALRMGALLPAPPTAIVGINAALGNFEGVEGWLFPLMAKAMALSPFAGTLAARLVGRPAKIARLIEGTGSSVSPAIIHSYARLAADPAHVDGTLQMMALWQLDPLLASLGQITTPVLLIATDRDRAVPARISQALAPRLPLGRCLLLEGLGHLAHEEAPERIAGPLRDFLSENGLMLS